MEQGQLALRLMRLKEGFTRAEAFKYLGSPRKFNSMWSGLRRKKVMFVYNHGKRKVNEAFRWDWNDS